MRSVNNADLLVLQLCKQKLNNDISKNILDFWCIDMHTIQGLKMLTIKNNRKAMLSNIKQLDLYCAEIGQYEYTGISGSGAYHVGIDYHYDRLQIQFMCCKKCGSYNMHYINDLFRGQSRIYCQCL